MPHSLRPRLKRTLHRRPSLQPLIPLPSQRISALPLLLPSFTHNPRQQPKPRHPSQIRITRLLTHKPLALGLLEMVVHNANNPLDLVRVPIQHTRQVLFGVVQDEPGALAEVGTLAGGLEVQPLVLKVLGRGGGGVEAVLLIVRIQKVFNDRARLEEGYAGVWVFDDGDAAVGVEGFEGFLVEDAEVHDLCLVWDIKLIENDGDFPGVGALVVRFVSEGSLFMVVVLLWVELTPAWE